MKKPLLITLASVIFLAGASVKINKDFSGLEQSLAQAEETINQEAEERLQMFRNGVSTALEEPKKDIYAENNSSKEELEDVLRKSQYNKNRSFNLGNSEIFYLPSENPIVFEGLATFYHTGHFPGKTATGAYFKDDLPTIAINPGAGVNVPALVKLTNIDEESQAYGTTILVIANDLGPWQGKQGHPERIVDMSRETKRRLGAEDRGMLKVRAEVIKEYDLGKN